MRAPTPCVAVTHVYLDRAVGAEYSTDFPEHFDQPSDELGRCFLKAYLAF